MKGRPLARKPRLTLVKGGAGVTPNIADIAPELNAAPPPKDQAARRWLTSLLIVVFAYGAPLLGWLMPTRNPGAQAPPPAAMVIEIAPAPVAPASQPDMPPGPQQTESAPPPEPKPEPEPEPEIPPPPPQVKPEVALNPQPEPVPEEKTVAEAPPEEPDEAPPEEEPQSIASAPPEAAQEDIEAAAPAQGVSTPAVNANAIPSWQNRLMLKLNAAKRYPPQARRYRQEGIAYLHFTIDRDGKVLATNIERSAGYPLLDEETLALIERAQPLPKPPAEMPGEALQFVVPVEFFLRR